VEAVGLVDLPQQIPLAAAALVFLALAAMLLARLRERLVQMVVMLAALVFLLQRKQI
jgi:hypothetical protein